MGFIYDKAHQKAALVQVLHGGDQLLTCTHLEGKGEDSVFERK